MSVPDDEDISMLEQRRLNLAKTIERQEGLNRAKESPEFSAIVLDSYRSMQLIERAALLLDPKKQEFPISFAMMQGRWRERLSLTEELSNGKRATIRQRNLLEKIGAKLKLLRAKLLSGK
jgi:hypothetical protein